MENMKSFHDRLENLQQQARRLTSAGHPLITLFDEEAEWLSREDEVSRLRASHCDVMEQLERVKWSESSASYGDTKVNLIFSLTGLAAKTILASTTKNQRAWNIVNNVFASDAHKKPFGTVMVCVGPKGLPDDVRVVSIAELARKSKRLESEVTSELQKRGYLLLGEKAFSLLIDRLVDAVREGRLRLPVSREKLSESTPSGEWKLLANNLE